MFSDSCEVRLVLLPDVSRDGKGVHRSLATAALQKTGTWVMRSRWTCFRRDDYLRQVFGPLRLVQASPSPFAEQLSSLW